MIKGLDSHYIIVCFLCSGVSSLKGLFNVLVTVCHCLLWATYSIEEKSSFIHINISPLGHISIEICIMHCYVCTHLPQCQKLSGLHWLYVECLLSYISTNYQIYLLSRFPQRDPGFKCNTTEFPNTPSIQEELSKHNL